MTNTWSRCRIAIPAILTLVISQFVSITTTAQKNVKSLSDDEQAFLEAVSARTSPVPLFNIDRRDLKRIEALLSADAVSSEAKSDALATAASCGDVELVYLLIRKGANVNYKEGHKGQTVLMLAASGGFCVLCGNDPMVTSYPGNTEIVRALLDAGVRLDERDKEGNTALMLAAQNARNNSTKLLIEAGANVHAQNKYGWTALIYAANSSGNYREANLTEIVRGLIANGADVNVRDREGKTALNYAAGSPAITEMLISAGAVK